ncbi:hypothetical protein CGCF413_v001627 [Colletotrichum fructicola]|nr:hypothetical protein CGCF413_v001627 [Colletotrichum fructicola]
MHLDHCIDLLRQSIQCTGDVVPNVFQYSPKYGDVRARSTVVHECRNFGKIQEWAAQHHVPGPFKDFGKGPELGKCGIDDPWTSDGFSWQSLVLAQFIYPSKRLSWHYGHFRPQSELQPR